MKYTTTIELFKEQMKFSAGHFTIFSSNERENIHGHNFTVHVSFVCENTNNGILIDYTVLKKWLIEICQKWDSVFILPELSPHLKIKKKKTHFEVKFAEETLIFLKRDVILLPIENTTVEDFAKLILDNLVSCCEPVKSTNMVKIIVRVYSGPGQFGSAEWLC